MYDAVQRLNVGTAGRTGDPVRDATASGDRGRRRGHGQRHGRWHWYSVARRRGRTSRAPHAVVLYREGAIINVRAIAGKNVEFLVNTKRDCANGKRANDLYIRMRIIAKAIARGEIMELATYYSGLTSQPGRGGLLQALKE